MLVTAADLPRDRHVLRDLPADLQMHADERDPVR